MVFGTWPAPAARALGLALARCSVVEHVVELAPYDAQAALLEGRVDLALIPTLDALVDGGSVDVVPGT